MTKPKLPPLTVAIVGDASDISHLTPIDKRLAVIAGHGVESPIRPDAIEIVTDIDLGPNMNRFEVMDAVVEFARRWGMYLLLRVVPHISRGFIKSRYFDTLPDSPQPHKDSDLPSLFDREYQEHALAYFRAVVSRYKDDPTVIAYGLAVGPSGEAQYKIAGTYVTDSSEAAFKDYRNWMAELGIEVMGFPEMPRGVSDDTRVSYDDPHYYLWAYWRVARLNNLLGAVAKVVKETDPEAGVYAFSYIEIAAPAGYGPGFADEDPNIDCFFGNISLDHGFFCPRNSDRSRPETLGRAKKLVAGEFDLISAYTDAIHMEAFVRYFYLMGMQPRTFIPIWWNKEKTGGWAEKFWTQYSDDLAREMARLVKANKFLSDTESVADVAIVVPNISAMGVMAKDMPWQSDEFKASHSDIARHLTAIGANFDLITEDTFTAGKLNGYRMVIVISPALYPNVRAALAECEADMILMGWSGTINAPGPGDVVHSHSWFNSTQSGMPTGGYVDRRAPKIRFTDELILGSAAGFKAAYGRGDQPVTYVRGLEGIALAVDDEGQTVFSVADWGSRKIYHFGIPLMAAGQGYIIGEHEFREILSNILEQSGCTAYGDLGPLRLYETTRYLLVENPRGTSGTIDKPEGDFDGVIPNKLKHAPASPWLTSEGGIRVKVPAGKSVIIELR